MKGLLFTLLALLVLLGVPVGVSALVNGGGAKPWSVANNGSTGLAPNPVTSHEAVVQIYAARTYSWRRIFAVHGWITFKPAGADRYTRVEVLGWRQGDKVVWNSGGPDDRWAGSTPTLLRDIRGENAEALIPAIEQAVAVYPWRNTYSAYPGPNSNTFLAYLARAVPGLDVDLPPTAIGKDWRPIDNPFGRAPSGTGAQVSLLGLLGLMIAPEEGVEVNILGLSLGLDTHPLALRLPGLGRFPAPSGS
ncbi:MAG: DUF3750 domain-containing protein [Rhodospirillum sp.]|nr:DUF3750 domain-containing protein [Rhodospirillum sp.]MCF8488942.1 DUF3750 domain-containing protein [Rhodospirillum sp.]MCF8498998.1 DUF3750 domain-containing protein [Rhodospirillum sp.]